MLGRDALALYSVLDPDHEDANKVVLDCMLQADVGAAERRLLLARLRALAAEPALDLPTAIDAETTFAWTIGNDAIGVPRAVAMPDGIRVSIASGLGGWLLLRAMLENGAVSGSVRFALPDGSHLDAEVSLDLGRLTGPWETGPILCEPSKSMVRATNRIDRAVALTDLVVWGEAGAPAQIVAEITISTAGTVTNVDFAPAITNDAVGPCLRRTLKGLKFGGKRPKADMSVKFPLKIQSL